ncbi:MAG TPA: YceI family protein [Dokdonella sp.]
MAALALAAGACAADTETVQLDGTRSRAEFTVKLLWLVNIGGRFGRVRGTVAIDRFRNQAVVDARIDADSVTMGNDRYESWVKSAEFFDVAHHPEIRFVSAPFALARLRNGGELPGTLTLRGLAQPVAFVLEPATCERPGYDCEIAVHGAIRRSDFEMRSRRGALGDKVELRFGVYAVAAPARLQP